MGQQGPPGAKNWLFSKMILDHMECQNMCFWCVLSLWWPVFALLKSQNALLCGRFELAACRFGATAAPPKTLFTHLLLAAAAKMCCSPCT